MPIAQEILALFRSLPAWEQEAVRRLLTQGRLAAADDDEILRLLLQESGISDGGSQVPARSLMAKDFDTSYGFRGSVFLSAVVAGQGCNRLLPGSTLPLDPGPGLSVILGANGTGKSSYVRLLRAACTARRVLPVLSNVFDEAAADGPADAVFRLFVDGVEQHVSWRTDAPQDPRLGAIAVFDGECSGVFVAAGNCADFTPGGVDVIPHLVELRHRMKAWLDAECLKTQDSFPMLPPEIGAGSVVWQRASELLAIGTEVGLAQLVPHAVKREPDVAVPALKPGQPAPQEAPRPTSSDLLRLGGSRAQLMRLAEVLRSAAALFDSSIEMRLSVLRGHIGVGRHLGGTSPEWFELVDAAVAYCDVHQPAGNPFRGDGHKAVCPLCRQELGDEGSRVLRGSAETEPRALRLELAGEIRSAEELVARLAFAIGEVLDSVDNPGLRSACNKVRGALPEIVAGFRYGEGGAPGSLLQKIFEDVRTALDDAAGEHRCADGTRRKEPCEEEHGRHLE